MGFIDKLMPLFNVAFISVILKDKECTIGLKVFKGGKLVEKEDKSFKTENKELTNDLEKIINNYQNKYKFSYVSTNITSVNQGAIPGITKARFSDFGINTTDIEYLSVNNGWSAYASVEDIKLLKEEFKNCGLDFVFSPFLILYYFFKRDFRDKSTLYILAQESSITMSVLKGRNFLFGANFVMVSGENDVFVSNDENSNNTDDSNKEEEEFISLDDGGFGDDEMIALDDLNNGEAFDDFKVTDGIGDSSDKDNKDATQSTKNNDNTNSNFDSFSKGMDMFKFIKKSLEEFYKNPIYKSEFVENIIIADSFGVPDDAIVYIKNELLMSVDIRKINLAETMINMAKDEVLN